ncbi:MAG TPA: class I SAM-dependent methyltransferase [Gemmatimonadales bacterium]|nr:class I SAM-dependent methyltransferase [Gemmatimonadales bacterium]
MARSHIRSPALLLFCFGCATRSQDVIFLPTAADITDRMLEVAAVTPDDLVFDLGCGDGRIVIRAAQRFGASGVCVELDPGLIARSQAAADTAGVRSRVRFVQGDMFETPLEGGTVVALYLSPALNQRLRPKLFRELGAGARVVSHNFGMGDWDADTVVTVTSERGASSAVRLWIIPADVAGTWELELDRGGVQRRYRLRLEQRYQVVTGTASRAGVTVEVTAVQLRGRRIGFTLQESRSEAIRLEGEIEAATARGTGWQAWRR